MSSSHQLFFFFFLLIFFSVIHVSTSVNTCPISCHDTGLGPVIRFPFRRKDQPFPCGYPGFELSCNNRSQTILNLPKLGNFTVLNIDYKSQTIWINDPDYCLPKRFLRSFSLSDTPFGVENLMEFTFYNCSSVGNTVTDVPGLRMVSCMSRDSFTVVAVPTYWSNVSRQGKTGSCSVINTVVIPFFWPSWSGLEQGVPLKWDGPDCKSCEERGGTCGYEKDITPIRSVGCANLPGSGTASWERVTSEELTREERKHISDAWLVSRERRHVDFLLDDRRLHELGFVVDLTEDRRRKVEKTLSKKKKITKIARERMADKGRVGEKKKKRVIRPPPSLIDEEEVLEAVAALKRTRGELPSVSVAIAGSTSRVIEAIPSRVATEKAPGVSRDDVEIVDSGENLPEDVPRDTLEQDTGISPNYFRSPPILGSVPHSNPINPETGVQYLCTYGKDLIRSEEISGYGKMSNVDRIRHGQAQLWQAFDSLLHMEDKYGDAKRRFDRVQRDKGKVEAKLQESEALVGLQRTIINDAAGSYRKAKASCRAKHNRLLEYRSRLKRANGTIRTMKADLGDNAVEMFLASEDFAEMQEEIFDKAVQDVQKLLLRSYPDFDFSAFNADVKKATENRKRAEVAPVANLSESCHEEPLSEDEPEAVSDDDERLILDRPLDHPGGKE